MPELRIEVRCCGPVLAVTYAVAPASLLLLLLALADAGGGLRR